nr:retrotransposon-related protein [Tanacetum cinerariifolium]
MQALVTKLQADPTSIPKFPWVDGQLRRKGRLVVGNDALLKQKIITYFHKRPLGGHSGIHVTAKKLANVFFCKGLRKMVRAFVKECDVCQRYKPDLSAYPDWLPLAEFWYNTNCHFATKITLYEIVYGQPPPVHLPYVPRDSMVEAVDRNVIDKLLWKGVLPSCADDGRLVVKPVAVLERRLGKVKNKPVMFVLVQ